MIDKNINDVLKYIQNKLNNSTDLNTRFIKIGTKKILYVFLESTSSDDKISNFFMKSVSFDVKEDIGLFTNLFNYLENTIPNSKLKIIETYDDVFYYLSNGFTCIFMNNCKCITIETKANLDRSISEPTTEAIVRGPKDCFTENYQKNIGLIRKRIKSESLWINEVKVGRRTKTKIGIMYLNDVVKKEKIDKIISKLNSIDIDGIIDSGYIRDFLVGKNEISFPKMLSSERPDHACISLLDGKIIIMVENSPFVLIIPGLFFDYFKSPEDKYEKTTSINITRLLRYIAFFITLLTPAIYISIMTYNTEIIPDKLLISLAIQRQGVPFPTVISILILLVTFEILRESDIRMPSLMGTSISIVGALVLGDAAVSAGIVSPFVVIIVAITSISGLVFSDIDFVDAIRWWRFIFIIGACFLGLVGVAITGIIFITKLSSIECLGTPYLAPITPFYVIKEPSSLFRKNLKKVKERSLYLNSKDVTRLGDISEK